MFITFLAISEYTKESVNVIFSCAYDYTLKVIQLPIL